MSALRSPSASTRRRNDARGRQQRGSYIIIRLMINKYPALPYFRVLWEMQDLYHKQYYSGCPIPATRAPPPPWTLLAAIRTVRDGENESRQLEHLEHPNLDHKPCRVQGSGFKVWGLGFTVQGLGFNPTPPNRVRQKG